MNHRIEVPGTEKLAQRIQIPDISMDKIDPMVPAQPIQIGIRAHPRKVIVESDLMADFTEACRGI